MTFDIVTSSAMIEQPPRRDQGRAMIEGFLDVKVRRLGLHDRPASVVDDVPTAAGRDVMKPAPISLIDRGGRGSR